MLRKLLMLPRKFSTSIPRKSPVRSTIQVAFGKYLLVTNTVSCGVLMFLGDLVQQEIEYQNKKLEKRYDTKRLGRMFIVGMIAGPIHHYFYCYINYLFPKRDMISISKKILMDQIVMSPVCIVQFFYCMGLLEDKSVKECNDELVEKFIDVYTVDWLVWPPTQFINFYLVPVKFQVFYINAVTMLYNVFLSYIKHKMPQEGNLSTSAI